MDFCLERCNVYTYLHYRLLRSSASLTKVMSENKLSLNIYAAPFLTPNFFLAPPPLFKLSRCSLTYYIFSDSRNRKFYTFTQSIRLGKVLSV